MKKIRILSATMALCLGVVNVPTIHVWPQQKLLAAEVSNAGSTVRAVNPTSFTYNDVYEAMIALKKDYPEGREWTNFTPYSSSTGAYTWKGGPVKGADGGVGCAAFAFILSDAAFGNLKARVLDRGSFTFDDIKPGDIMRVNNNSHFVIVLQKSAGGVILAEGNYNKSVHWGRAMSKAEVEDATFIITRYPTNFVSADTDGANDVFKSGTEGSLSWSLTNAGTLTISGSGIIPNFSSNDDNPPSWNEYNKYINTIIIEDGITGIGNYAFQGSNALSVYIPDTVTSIGEGAFCESGILSVTIPSSVKTIGKLAFYWCRNLTSVTVPEGVTTICDQAFRACDSLAYIDFPASITSVGAGAFMDCSKMTSVRFIPGNGKVMMGDNLFSSCYALTSVILPQGADCISKEMFHSCSLLATLYIPAGVEKIKENAFNQCFALRNDGIYFGGSETRWTDTDGIYVLNALLNTMRPYNYTVPVYFDVEFKDPFAHGDEHGWGIDWNNDNTYHWHECQSTNCPITENSEKNGFGEHTFVKDKDGTGYTCSVCGYSKEDGKIDTTQPEIILSANGTKYTDSINSSNAYDGSVVYTVSVQGEDSPLKSFSYKLDGAAAINLKDGDKITVNTNGVHKLEITAEDSAGNKSVVTKNFRVYSDFDFSLSANSSNNSSVYNGQPIEPETDFKVITSGSTGKVDFSYSVVGTTEKIEGLPVNAGNYLIYAEIAEDTENCYKPQKDTLKYTISPQQISSLHQTLYFAENHATEYTFDVANMLHGVEGNTEYSIASVSGSSVIADTPSLKGSILTIPVKAVNSEEQTATIEISFSNPNYVIANAVLTLVPTNKKIVKLSNVIVPETMVYSGEKFAYSGTPIWKTEDGNSVKVSSVTVLYESIDGAGYSSSEAPVNVGSYEVTISVGNTDSNYIGTESFAFDIVQKTVNVTVKDKNIFVGDSIPSLAELKEGTDYSMEGLVSDDAIVGTLDFVYTDENGKEITPDNTVAGTYLIVASGLDNPNYDFVYTAGKLVIETKASSGDDNSGSGSDDGSGDGSGDNSGSGSDDGSGSGSDDGSGSSSGGSSSGSSSGGSIVPPTNSTTTPSTSTMPSTDSSTIPPSTTPSTSTSNTETKPDGTVVKTEEQVALDGTKTETVAETRTDGTKTETVTKTATDGTVLEERVTETAVDGSAVATTKTTTTNSLGTAVSKVTVENIAASGNVTKTTEESTFSADNAKTVVTTVKDGSGSITEASASVSKQGEITATGKTKLVLSNALANQITEAAGTNDVDITVSVTDETDRQLYSLTVNKKKLESGNNLYLYGYDAATDTYTMINAVEYKVTDDTGVTIKASAGRNYTLLDQAEMTLVSKQILKTVKLSTSTKTKKSGKSFKVALSKKANTASIKKITYATSNKKIASVNKNGQVKTKAKGTVRVRAKVTMKNGKTKTLVLKVKVKK